MFTEKRDFGLVGKIFGVPRRWLTRIASFCTSLTVSHPILTIKKPDFPDPTKNPVEIGINETALVDFITKNSGSKFAEQPKETVSLAATYPGSETASNASWTAGGDKGVIITEHTRTLWTGTVLFGFYRTKTYDRFGRLYSVSGETRYVIDTPVAYSGT